MSRSNSDSNDYESPSSSSDNIIEEETELSAKYGDESDDCLMDAYADEPLADEEWLAAYERRREEDKKHLEQLTRRWNGAESVKYWCKCGNCNVGLLENPRECCCCTEISKCSTVLSDTKVIEVVGQQPPCITEHPGFGAVCLNRWSLELAANTFKTRDGRRYNQISSKERFLRAIAYRQFTRLVHGRLKDKRIPLPACAYHVILSTFMVEGDDHRGFEELDSD